MSGRRDSNTRPPVPQTVALPGCATPRSFIFQKRVQRYNKYLEYANKMQKKFYIETYGCQMNVADSEVVAAIMETTDAELTERWEDADIILLNTCSIRDNAEQKVGARLRELKGLMEIGRAHV